MSNVFDSFADKPNQIREEGQEISLRFSRIDDSSGKLTWNIPPSFKGCTGDGVYNGIVITVSDKPANYIGSSPKDGEYYVGDPTVDSDIHAGSKIQDNVFVVGAFYDDRTTTELEVSNLKPRTPYYFSAYAVDNVARYHREGVHSYSLPTGDAEGVGDEALPGRHSIMLEQKVKLTTSTGLDPDTDYDLKLDLNCNEVEIPVRGRESLTYKGLIDEINYQLLKTEDPYESPTFPYKNSVFVDDGKYYLWDGQNKSEIYYISSNTPQNSFQVGEFWFNPATNKIYEYESGGWEELSLFDLSYDMTTPPDFTVWFDGTDAWMWEANQWCELNVINSTRNPLLPPKLSASSFWYNTETYELYKWDKKKSKWEEAYAIYYPIDPNDITIGDFWFNETDEKVYVYRTGGDGWGIQGGVRYSERDDSGELPEPLPEAGDYWYIPSEQKLFIRNLMNTDWEELEIAHYPTDPLDRESCDIWWDSSTSIDYIFVWDKVNQDWVEAEQFTQSEKDPSKSPELPDNTVWYNPNTEVMLRILDDKCEEYPYLRTDFDPTDPPIGIIWKHGDELLMWNGSSWVAVDALYSEVDPLDVPDGTYWLETDTEILWLWEDDEWVRVDVLSYDPKPKEGFVWWNTIEEKLYMWKIDEWVETTGIAYIDFIQGECAKDKDKLQLKTRKRGCDAVIEIKQRESVFAHLDSNVRYGYPFEGMDLMNGSPMWKELGVGDDGSPDERRELHDAIRQLLGAPATKVELSKPQLDTCIDNALKQLRKYSGQSYKRGFFFLTLWPNQQVYELKDRCVDFHKIQRVNTVHRLRSGFLRGAYSGYDIYGYAALKQLYTLGTFDILSFYLVSSFIEELEHLFATRLTFQWVERTRELKLYNAVHKEEKVLVDANIERTEQDLMTDRETNLWLQRWAVAEAKMALSQSRGKFQSLPGPNGQTILNAQELITQSEAEKAVLMEELEDPAMSNAIEVGQKAFFVLG